jgi:cytochrome c
MNVMLALVLVLCQLSGPAFAGGDPDKGAAIFDDICGDCHTVTKGGTNRRGPNLYKVIGRPAGQVANFEYSDANKNSKVVWGTEILEPYLKNPQAVIPGTNMKFKGLPEADDRQDVIAFLETAQ